MSEDSFDIDVVSQRSFRTFTPLVIGNGILNFPPGTIINALSSTIILNGQFLDQLVNENIVQGLSLTEPNSVSSSIFRSLLVSSRNSALSGTGQDNTILSSDGSTLDSTVLSSLISTDNCQISNNSTGLITQGLIHGSLDSSITNSGALTFINPGISSSGACTITGAAGLPSSAGITRSSTCAMNATSQNIARCIMDGNLQCTMTNNGTAALAQSGIINCTSCNMIHSTVNLQNSLMIGCGNCNITTTLNDTLRSAIIASVLSNIDGGSSVLIGGCTSCGVTSSAANRTINTSILGSQTATINSTAGLAARVSIHGSVNAAVSGPCTNVTASGLSPIVTAFNNVFCHSATATSSNQAIFGTRLDVTGTGNNATISGGYVHTDRGLSQTYRQINNGTTLVINDNLLHNISTISRQIVIPTAASMGASFPLNSSKTFIISGVETLTPSRIFSSGTDVFNNVAGLTTYYLDKTGSVINLALINGATPFWKILNSYPQSAEWSTAVANNFGVGAQANASLLPVSLNEGNHKTLTTTSYYIFEGLSADNTVVFQKGTSDIGFRTNSAGWAKIVFSISILHTTAVVGTPFLIRCDIRNQTGGASIQGSYCEFSGTNDASASNTYQYTVPYLRLSAGTYNFRISQDGTYSISAAASITLAKVAIEMTF